MSVAPSSDALAQGLGSTGGAAPAVPQAPNAALPMDPSTVAPTQQGFTDALAEAIPDAPPVDIDALPEDQRRFLESWAEQRMQAHKAELQRIHAQQLNEARAAQRRTDAERQQLIAWQQAAIKHMEGYTSKHGDPRDLAVFLMDAQGHAAQATISEVQAEQVWTSFARQQVDGVKAYLTKEAHDGDRQLFDPRDPQLVDSWKRYMAAAQRHQLQGDDLAGQQAAQMFDQFKELVRQKREQGLRAALTNAAQTQEQVLQAQQARQLGQSRGVQTLARGAAGGAGPLSFSQVLAAVKAESNSAELSHSDAFDEAMRRFERQSRPGR